MVREQLISVIIAERPYRLAVKSEGEEQLFRSAARVINEKMKEYGSNFAFRDKQDLLAMACLQFAVEVLRYDTTSREHLEMKNRLQQLDQLLEEGLKG